MYELAGPEPEAGGVPVGLLFRRFFFKLAGRGMKKLSKPLMCEIETLKSIDGSVSGA
jgi:hypothetical protein